MAKNQDLYATLGIDPHADHEEVRSAYRMAARRFHPDVNGNAGATMLFREIASAYEVLSDAGRRHEYDARTHNQYGDREQPFGLHVTTSAQTIPLIDEPQVLYVLYEISAEGSKAQGNSSEVALNLTLVIDKSTSMQGKRLEQVKGASHQIIDMLGENDVLSIISFADRAEIVVPASYVKPAEKSTLKAMVSTMRAEGGTEILQGLIQGLTETRRHLDRHFVNHIILLTDGRTYGDEHDCLLLADNASTEGIGISAMGIGDEWNDAFLDELASRTGGNSAYISSAGGVRRFLNDRVRNLGATYAERMRLVVAPDPDIKLETAFRLIPDPQSLVTEPQPIPLGSLTVHRPMSFILQLQLSPQEKPGPRSLIRTDIVGDILQKRSEAQKIIKDIHITVDENAPEEAPPRSIVDALGKLTLYRMQMRAQQSIEQGQIGDATRRLENLATRLLASGEENLAYAALAEAKRVAQTHSLSKVGHKTLKYGTRSLLLAPPKDEP